MLSGTSFLIPAASYNKGETSLPDLTVVLPLGGNTWAKNIADASRVITLRGIENWTNSKVYFETYLRVNQIGAIKIKVRAKADGQGVLQLEINGTKKEVVVKEKEFKWFDAGEWILKDTGYIKIILTGISKTGTCFAYISDYEISGAAINAKTVFVKNNDGNFFYWGRRGPSVHFSYPFADSIKAKWFYNEVTVPAGQDVIGSYYMADGFGEGYFGIQVNSATERRVLFSVWSPFTTDDPKNIPENMRITLLKKGDGVNTGEFGNEGSGGQSFLRYNWKAGTTYKFLLKGEPDANDNTVYTAYFFAPEKNSWMLIASCQRPKTNTYLKRFHSFLENFSPDQGDKERRVLFSNQWFGDANGNWIELNKAVFTYDNTAAKGYRMDYSGGIEKGQFVLKNCGFFNDFTPYKTVFARPRTNKTPQVIFEDLPK